MRTVIITGSAGLIGSEAVKRFANEGRRVVEIDSDMRAKFFGALGGKANSLAISILCFAHLDKTKVVSAVARALLTSSASRGGVDRNRN
jgi:NAD dependent epimerase/dehydratase family.